VPEVTMSQISNGPTSSNKSSGDEAEEESDLLRTPSLHRHYKPQRIDEGDLYIENCQRFHVNVDPSVVITLKTSWHVLKPTKAFCEGSMLPLFDILSTNTFIKKLDLEGAGMVSNSNAGPGNGNSNARILGLILRKNTTITELNLSRTGLDDDGVIEVCKGLGANPAVRRLRLARNNFGERGAEAVRAALAANGSLEWLDLSRNALGFTSVHRLMSCPCNRLRKKDMDIEGNFVFEEVLNAMSHAIGFVAAAIGAATLLGEAYATGSARHIWACAIYSSCLMFLYISSTLYHSFFMLPLTNKILKICDHCAIYTLIAGTYSPLMMIGLRHSPTAVVVVIMEWLLCFLGCVFSISVPLGTRLSRVVEMTVYLVMGLMVLAVWPEFKTAIPAPAVELVKWGGVVYITGILFYVLDKKKPIFHSVWHMFVLIASILHWFSVYKYVLPMNIL